MADLGMVGGVRSVRPSVYFKIFYAVFWSKFMPNNRLVPPGWRPSGKSWIGHCLDRIVFWHSLMKNPHLFGAIIHLFSILCIERKFTGTERKLSHYVGPDFELVKPMFGHKNLSRLRKLAKSPSQIDGFPQGSERVVYFYQRTGQS